MRAISLGASLAENQHAEAAVLAPREAWGDAQPQMTHGAMLKGIVIERLVQAAASELGAKGLLPYRARAYREALATSNFFGDRGGDALVPRHADVLPERRWQRVHLFVGQTVQWIVCTRAD